MYRLLRSPADQRTPKLSDVIFPTFVYPLEHISNQPADLFCTIAFIFIFGTNNSISHLLALQSMQSFFEIACDSFPKFL